MTKTGRFFTRAEWARLSGFYAVIVGLHLCGWGACLYYSRTCPALLGMAFAAYLFGLRHAFDADHIAAVDDTVRYLIGKGQRPLGVGFFFSLGHATIVLMMAIATVFAADAVARNLPQWQVMGALIGGTVSAAFLLLIGTLNLRVLVQILKSPRAHAPGHRHDHLAQLLSRGLFSRLFGKWVRPFLGRSWHMYPLGLLFGLGFDTASEIGLLALAAGAAAGHVPVGAILSLPILFAAGMAALDTTDGVLMVKAYDWAFVNPARRNVYNIVVTGFSVAAALAIGTIEALQVLIALGHLQGRNWDWIGRLELRQVGYWMVAMLLGAWVIAAVRQTRRQAQSCHQATNR